MKFWCVQSSVQSNTQACTKYIYLCNKIYLIEKPSWNVILSIFRSSIFCLLGDRLSPFLCCSSTSLSEGSGRSLLRSNGELRCVCTAGFSSKLGLSLSRRRSPFRCFSETTADPRPSEEFVPVVSPLFTSSLTIPFLRLRVEVGLAEFLPISELDFSNSVSSGSRFFLEPSLLPWFDVGLFSCGDDGFGLLPSGELFRCREPKRLAKPPNLPLRALSGTLLRDKAYIGSLDWKNIWRLKTSKTWNLPRATLALPRRSDLDWREDSWWVVIAGLWNAYWHHQT